MHECVWRAIAHSETPVRAGLASCWLASCMLADWARSARVRAACPPTHYCASPPSPHLPNDAHLQSHATCPRAVCAPGEGIVQGAPGCLTCPTHVATSTRPAAPPPTPSPIASSARLAALPSHPGRPAPPAVVSTSKGGVWPSCMHALHRDVPGGWFGWAECVGWGVVTTALANAGQRGGGRERVRGRVGG